MSDKPISQAKYDALKQELAEAKRALAKSDEYETLIRKLTRAIEQSPTSIVITDAGGAIEYANPKFTELTGWTLEEALGRNPRILKTPHTDPAIYKDLWRTINSGGEWRGRFVNKKKNGELFWESASISGIRDDNGEITHYVAVKEDITAQTQIERQIRENEARYRLLAENVTDVIWTIDLDGTFTYISPSVYALRGYTPEEVLGQTLEDVTTSESFELVQTALTEARESYIRGELISTHQRLEITQPCKDGSLVVTEANANAVFDEDGEFIGILGVSRDITERKKLEQERERLIGDLDSFAHMVAHDIKNPLALINGYAYLLSSMRDNFNQVDFEKAVEAISTASERAVNIVDSLLLFASVRKQDAIPQQKFDMANVVEQAVNQLESMITDYNAELALPESWPSSIGYGPWIKEVWVNYISNALKYGGSPPHIELGSTPEDHMIRYWIRDNGQGIATDMQDKLFQSFERLGQVRIEGHGVGLSIVKRITEKLGGSVGVDSAAGEGSTFWFTLPEG